MKEFAVICQDKCGIFDTEFTTFMNTLEEARKFAHDMDKCGTYRIKIYRIVHAIEYDA